MGRGARELLDDVSEVVLVDVVDRRLVLGLCLQVLRLGLGLGLGIVETLILVTVERGMILIKQWRFLDDGFGDLVGELVEVLQVLISASSGAASATTARRGGYGRIP